MTVICATQYYIKKINRAILDSLQSAEHIGTWHANHSTGNTPVAIKKLKIPFFMASLILFQSPST